MAARPRCYVFVFPPFVGHINPSLPLSRTLVEEGHAVHYVCHEHARAKIEGTGATFHSVIDVQPELYTDPEMDFCTMFGAMAEEFGLDVTKVCTGLATIKWIMLERQLPGLLRLFTELEPDAVVYCPERSLEGCIAAKLRALPRVALITFAGPAAAGEAQLTVMEAEETNLHDFDRMLCQWEPNTAAVDRLNERYGLALRYGLPPVRGVLEGIEYTRLSLTTTSHDLQDPMSPELEHFYRINCAAITFAAVGPLLDREGTWKSTEASSVPTDVVSRVRTARALGRKVVMVSMGTLLTGDLPTWGWEGRQVNRDGQLFGLTGRELCHSVWQATFDTFGADRPDDGPLIVVALGPQPNPLGEISVPPNAICSAFHPQVDVLAAGVDVFLTHGGQNSFTEALANSTPVVVCPGIADQHTNARKAERLGVGLKVERPYPLLADAPGVCNTYRAHVANALREVYTDLRFQNAAQACAQRLREAGGITRAVELIHQIANKSSIISSSFGGA